MKKYVTPFTKVLGINVSNSIMEPAPDNTSGKSDETYIEEEPLF